MKVRLCELALSNAKHMSAERSMLFTNGQFALNCIILYEWLDKGQQNVSECRLKGGATVFGKHAVMKYNLSAYNR